MLRDLRFAARGLARTPGFTIVAILSLALGIMATTAIYSVVHAVILDPFPYKDVDHLMSVRVANTAQRGGRTNYSIDQFVEIAERNTIFEGVIASTISPCRFSTSRCPRYANRASPVEVFRYSFASGSVRDACVSFVRVWPCQATSTLRPAGGSDGGPSLGLKLLCDAHASNSVPSTEK